MVINSMNKIATSHQEQETFSCGEQEISYGKEYPNKTIYLEVFLLIIFMVIVWWVATKFLTKVLEGK